VYVVPVLARAYADPTLEPEQREVHAAVFRALHQYRAVLQLKGAFSPGTKTLVNRGEGHVKSNRFVPLKHGS